MLGNCTVRRFVLENFDAGNVTTTRNVVLTAQPGLQLKVGAVFLIQSRAILPSGIWIQPGRVLSETQAQFTLNTEGATIASGVQTYDVFMFEPVGEVMTVQGA